MQFKLDLKRPLAACAAAMALVAVPASSSATVFTNVYEGYVAFGIDSAGLFGGGSSLDGRAIEIRMSFDDTVNRFTIPGLGDSLTTSAGLSPFVAASVTIDGITIDFSPSAPAQSFSRLSTLEHSLEQKVEIASNQVDGAPVLQLDAFVNSNLLPATLDTPLDLTAADTFGRFDASFFIGHYSGLFQTDFGDAVGGVTLTRAYTLTDTPSDGGDPVSTVPEPAAWSLMILGFVAAGASLRRRPAFGERLR